MAAIYSNGGNRWNILAFDFTKRDALSSVYKISMDLPHDATRACGGGRGCRLDSCLGSKVAYSFPVRFLVRSNKCI
jgi:hypothetical protein